MDEQTAVNNRDADPVRQTSDLLEGGAATGPAAAQLLMAHAVGIAMLNVVAQQQQQHILQNALVTAAAKAALESRTEEAVRLAREAMTGMDVVATLRGLKDLMRELMQEAGLSGSGAGRQDPLR